MIIRVWGVVNSTEVEFTPIPDRPGSWEGYAPKVPGLQDIEIWAESDSGLRGHLKCAVAPFQGQEMAPGGDHRKSQIIWRRKKNTVWLFKQRRNAL